MPPFSLTPLRHFAIRFRHFILIAFDADFRATPDFFSPLEAIEMKIGFRFQIDFLFITLFFAELMSFSLMLTLYAASRCRAFHCFDAAFFFEML